MPYVETMFLAKFRVFNVKAHGTYIYHRAFHVGWKLYRFDTWNLSIYYLEMSSYLDENINCLTLILGFRRDIDVICGRISTREDGTDTLSRNVGK
jgi:hypothetical protein